MYTRVRDIFNRPIASVPGSQFELSERISDDYNWTYRSVFILYNFLVEKMMFFRYTGKKIRAINLGSYNYLGFAEKTGPCATDATNAIKSFAIANCSTRIEAGKEFFFFFSANKKDS
jgi:serine palmitoyltransferase